MNIKAVVIFLVSSCQMYMYAMEQGFGKALDALKALRAAVEINTKDALQGAITRYKASSKDIQTNTGVLPKFKEAEAALAKLSGGDKPVVAPPVVEVKGELKAVLQAAQSVKSAIANAKKAGQDAKLSNEDKATINEAAGMQLF